MFCTLHFLSTVSLCEVLLKSLWSCGMYSRPTIATKLVEYCQQLQWRDLNVGDPTNASKYHDVTS